MDDHTKRLVAQVEQLADGQIVRNARIKALEEAVEEARSALRWIASNADVPADFQNQHVRLRQVQQRAAEGLADVLALAGITPGSPPLPRTDQTNGDTDG